jgi:putative integral membrane protein (TIGR02587 family)
MARDPGFYDEFREFLRGMSGAFLLGIPLLYTMEMWFIGEVLTETEILSLLVFAFVMNYALATLGWFRRETHRAGTLEEAIDSMAVGIVTSIVVLATLNRISWDLPFGSNVGMIALEAVPLSIGTSLSNLLFARGGTDAHENMSTQHHRAKESTIVQRTLTDIGATIAGAAIIGFSIAPTDEVTMLANELGSGHELALIFLSLVITYSIVFISGFDPQGEMSDHGIFQHPLTETTMSYVVALALSFVLLLLFNQVSWDDPLHHIVSQVLVLGFPAAIGGAAGRIAI